MRKFIISLIAVAFALSLNPANASLFQYYQSLNQPLPSVLERAETAAELGIFGYIGTKEQNILFEQRLREFAGNPGDLGISVVSRYKTTLLSSMTSSQTTIPVSSLATFDGDTLTMDILGGAVYLVLEPGLSKEEIVKCTAITDGRFSSCTRGLKFSGSDESGVANNRFAHNAGSVVVMSNTHYVYENFIQRSGDQAIDGVVTFTQPPVSLLSATTSQQLTTLGQVTSTLASYPTLSGNNSFSGTNSFSNNSSFASSSSFTGTVTVPYSTASSSAASVGLVNDTANAGAATAATTTKGISKLSVDPVDPANPIVVGDNDSRLLGGFGGDGSDGALSVSSGTTTIDLLGERIVTKNYTSISITGTGVVNFSNPHSEGSIIILKSQGNTTLTSSATPMLDASGTGGPGTTGGTRSTTGGSTSGTDANDIPAFYGEIDTYGGDVNVGGVVGTFDSLTSLSNWHPFISKYGRKIFIGAGASGGRGTYTSGGSGSIIGGDGGRGTGILIVETGGSWNFTTANGISVSGQNGTDGSITGTPSSYHAGGGGGGAAGMFFGVYNTLTANSGSVTVSGGLGGRSKVGSSNNGNAGGSGGGNGLEAGDSSSAGTVDGTRYAGSGADGLSFIFKNTDF